VTYNVLQLTCTWLDDAMFSRFRYLSAHKAVVSNLKLMFGYVAGRTFQTDGSEHLLSTVDGCCKVDLLPWQRKMPFLRRQIMQAVLTSGQNCIDSTTARIIQLRLP